jgi:hypothetical protein
MNDDGPFGPKQSQRVIFHYFKSLLDETNKTVATQNVTHQANNTVPDAAEMRVLAEVAFFKSSAVFIVYFFIYLASVVSIMKFKNRSWRVSGLLNWFKEGDSLKDIPVQKVL